MVAETVELTGKRWSFVIVYRIQGTIDMNTQVGKNGETLGQVMDTASEDLHPAILEEIKSLVLLLQTDSVLGKYLIMRVDVHANRTKDSTTK